MLLQVLDGGRDHLERDELVAAALETGDDLADQATVDTVGPEQGTYERQLLC